MDVPGNGDRLMLEASVASLEAEDGNGAGDGNGWNGNGAHEQPALPAMLEERELGAILEAMLFVSPEPLTLDRLASVLGEVSKPEVEGAIRRLQATYDDVGRGIQLVEVAGGFRVMTRPDYAPWIKRLEKVKAAPKLSRSGLETLAIIAYRQPIVRGEIEKIRGVETSGVLRTLLERKLIRMVGRKDVPGRPIMYGTTKFFLEHFGLRDLAELPPLREFKELGEPEQFTLLEDDDPIHVDSAQGGQDPPAEGDPASASSDFDTSSA